jgi:WXG100 family type VII secretion target
MNGISGIRVTPEQLHAVSAGVVRGASDIDATLATLRGQVLPLLGGEWAGAAAAQFNTMFEQWQRAAGDLNRALQGISRLVDRAGATYAQAEQAIAASFR